MDRLMGVPIRSISERLRAAVSTPLSAVHERRRSRPEIDMAQLMEVPPTDKPAKVVLAPSLRSPARPRGRARLVVLLLGVAGASASAGYMLHKRAGKSAGPNPRSTSAPKQAVAVAQPPDSRTSADSTPSQRGSRSPAASPRTPPAGTPRAIASAFRRLPLSPDDRAPVGAVGEGGVHVDRIELGTGYTNSRCTGTTTSFSAASDRLANVCIRVVHPRREEELVVTWERSDHPPKRRTLEIRPTHAYRTRAYLILRNDHVGTWTVRVQTQDGIELARRDFEVVP